MLWTKVVVTHAAAQALFALSVPVHKRLWEMSERGQKMDFSKITR